MSYDVDEFYRDIEHRLAWDMVKPEHKAAPLHDADDAWDCACRMTDHAAVPCPAPPTERACDDCADVIPDGEGCRHDGHVWCGSCFVERCPECVADIRDDMAAEAAEEWRLQ